MSNYSQITSFTPKDSLPTGNPSKVIMGADFDGEFNAISVAVATKADSTTVSSLSSTVSALSTTVTALDTEVGTKQDTLVSGTTIKTINSTSLLGSGNITTGDVVGPASSTDNAIARFDSTTGKLVQNSTATLSDTGELAGITGVNGGQLAGLRNKIINGKMEIAQRGTSFVAIASATYSLDRWQWVNTSTGVVTASQSTSVPSSNEFLYSLSTSVTTADASIAAGERAEIRHVVEGYNARDLIGKTFTLSFWVRSSKTGVHCAALRNSGGDRSYVAEYTVNAANTWEQKSVTVSGGLITAGTWDWTNGQGITLTFSLATGSTYHTTANAWQTGNYLATANQVNCLDTIGNVFAITGVQLEVGSVATPFEHRPYGMELALCQRYYQRQSYETASQVIGIGMCLSATNVRVFTSFPVQMRTAPSALEQSGTAANYTVQQSSGGVSCSAVPSFVSAFSSGAVTSLTVGSGLTAGQAVLGRIDTSGAYLGWSAEL